MAGACLYVFLIAGAVELPVPRFVWLIVAAVAAGLSLFVGFTMALLDVFMLKLQVAALPSGWRAWLMGFIAPMPVFFTWQKLVKFAFTGVVPFLLAFFVPMFVVALATRLLLRHRPKTWKTKA
jgi:hypothetical protein